ncbi:MAG: phage major capsid protein [Rickettsiales bacterium]
MKNTQAIDVEIFQKYLDQRGLEIQQKGTTVAAIQKLAGELEEIKAAAQRPMSDTKNSAQGEDLEHKKAFCAYLRKGIDTNLTSIEKKALSVANDADGGFLVTSVMSERIGKRVGEFSPLRQIASVTEISSDALEIIEDKDAAFAGWTLETEVREETTSPTLAKKVIQVHELYAQPKATQKLMDDASIDIEGWLSEKIVDVFSQKENAAFVSGNGVGKPKGILSYSDIEIEQIPSGENGSVTAEGIFNLFYSLRENYAVKGKFLMSRSAVQAVRMLKDTSNGKYLWQPGLTVGTPDTLLGAEVVVCPDMPLVSSGALAIAFGDFKAAYQIVDRQGVRILRDPFTEKPFVKFYTTKRVGGDVINFDAIKLLKLSA